MSFARAWVKLKEVKLGDGLLKYKQSQVHVPQCKLTLLVLKEKYNSLLVGYRGKNHHRVVSRRCHWPCMKNDITRFVKACVKCQVNGTSYQMQTGLLQPLPIPPAPWHSVAMT